MSEKDFNRKKFEKRQTSARIDAERAHVRNGAPNGSTSPASSFDRTFSVSSLDSSGSLKATSPTPRA